MFPTVLFLQSEKCKTKKPRSFKLELAFHFLLEAEVVYIGFGFLENLVLP